VRAARLAAPLVLVAALAGLVPLAGCSTAGNASAAEPSGSARSCASAWLSGELHAASSVELLVAAGDTIPASRWPAYRAMAAEVAGCAGVGATITLRPITADSLTELPLFAGEVPSPTGQDAVNPLRYRSDLRAFVLKTGAAFDRLPQLARGVTGSDPLGAMQAAAGDLRLESGTSPRVVVAIFNGWQQSRSLNLFRYGEDPAASTGLALRALRASGALPELGGADVVIAGLTTGTARMQTSDAQLAELCTFWRSVIAAGHGSLKLCAAALPGISRTP
jgi:hypothetical protein